MYLDPVFFQTFWSKYKVLILGMFSAVVSAISPLVFNNHQGEPYNYKAILIAGVIAAATLYGQEARGKNWTIGGQIAAGLIALVLAYQDNYDPFRIIIAVMAAFGSIPISPVKPSTYEHAPTIVQAKEEANEISIIRKENAKSSAPTENIS